MDIQQLRYFRQAWKLREAFNSNRLNSAYYRVLDPKYVK